MTTPARYPTTDEVFAKLVASWADQERPAYDEIIRTAIDIERERVAKEAGEVSCWRVAGGTWVDGEPLPCDYKDAEQNGWAIELAYTEQALPKKDSNETHVVAAQNPAVKVPDDVMESAKFLAQWFPGGGLYRDHASAILSFIQSLTHPTETPR